jgi:hypothetical protein
VLDDTKTIRELRFNYGRYHVLITVQPEGEEGEVRVLDDFFHSPIPQIRKVALKATLKMLSIARHLVFEAYKQEGGTIQELQDDTVDKL